MKKILSFVMAIMFMTTLFSGVTALADDNTVVVDGVTFSKDMKTLISYSPYKKDKSYTIPASVTNIDNRAFGYRGYWGKTLGNEYLKYIIIPDGVISIGEYAFEGCTALTSVTIPGSVKKIGNRAFYGCTALTNVNILDGATSIGIYAFYGCTSLKSINLPDSIVYIGRFAFWSCTSLTSITIPSAVENIEIYTFVGCSSLKSISIPNSVVSIGDGAFSKCTSLESITLPDSVTSIEGGAFSECTSLRSIAIPNGVTKLERSPFSKCTSLEIIFIPQSVTLISSQAFNGCTSLTDVYYGGTEDEWNSIDVGENNTFLKTANIHFSEPDNDEIKVAVYGKKLKFDQPPVIENGRTLVPLRAIFEALDASVAWDDATQTVRAIRDGRYIELQIGSTEMKVDNEIRILEVPAQLVNGRTMVPARAVAEAFNLTVSWDEANLTVVID